MDTIDLVKLAQALRAAPEEKELTEPEPPSGYLKEHLLPILYADRYPSLYDLDFDEFEKEDLCDLDGYLREFGRVEYNLTRINAPICLAPPKAAKARVFL